MAEQNPQMTRGWTKMHAAAKAGDLMAARKLLGDDRQLLDCTDKYGVTPLHVAVHYKQVNFVDFAMKQGGNSIDCPGLYDGRTPLHVAALEGNLPVLQLLLQERPKSIDAEDRSGCTPLLIAARCRQAAAVELLLNAGSTALETPDHTGATPLSIAVSNADLPVALVLLRAGCQFDQQDRLGRTPLHCVARLDRHSPTNDVQITDFIDVLRALGADLNLSTSGMSTRIVQQLQQPMSAERIQALRELGSVQSLLSLLLRVLV